MNFKVFFPLDTVRANLFNFYIITEKFARMFFIWAILLVYFFMYWFVHPIFFKYNIYLTVFVLILVGGALASLFRRKGLTMWDDMNGIIIAIFLQLLLFSYLISRFIFHIDFNVLMIFSALTASIFQIITMIFESAFAFGFKGWWKIW